MFGVVLYSPWWRLRSNNVVVVVDVPQDDSGSPALGDFVTLHRAEYKAMNNEVNALKLKVNRLMTLENAKHTSASHHFQMAVELLDTSLHLSCLVFKYPVLRTTLVAVSIGRIFAT